MRQFMDIYGRNGIHVAQSPSLSGLNVADYLAQAHAVAEAGGYVLFLEYMSPMTGYFSAGVSGAAVKLARQNLDAGDIDARVYIHAADRPVNASPVAIAFHKRTPASRGGALAAPGARSAAVLTGLLGVLVLAGSLAAGTVLHSLAWWGAGTGVLAWGINVLPRMAYAGLLFRSGQTALTPETAAAQVAPLWAEVEAAILPSDYRRPEVRLLPAQGLGSRLWSGWRLAYGRAGTVYLHPRFSALPAALQRSILLHEVYEAHGLGHGRATWAEFTFLARTLAAKILPSRTPAATAEVSPLLTARANDSLRGLHPVLTRWLSRALGTLLHPAATSADGENGLRLPLAGTAALWKGMLLLLGGLAWLLVWLRPAAAAGPETAEISAAWFISQAEDTAADVYTRFGAGDFLRPNVAVQSTAALSWFDRLRYFLGGHRTVNDGPVLFVPGFLLRPKARAGDEQLRQILLRATLEHQWRLAQGEGRLHPWTASWATPAPSLARVWTRLRMSFNPEGYLSRVLVGDASPLALALQQPGHSLHLAYRQWAAQPSLENSVRWLEASLAFIQQTPDPTDRIRDLLTLQRLALANPYLTGSSPGIWQTPGRADLHETQLILPDLFQVQLRLKRELTNILRALPLALDSGWLGVQPGRQRSLENAV
jgi:hypothetical protein